MPAAPCGKVDRGDFELSPKQLYPKIPLIEAHPEHLPNKRSASATAVVRAFMPRVFLSYRRNDAAGMVGRISEQICARFGHDSIFVDVTSIAHGVDFRTGILDALNKCDVLVAVIGERWIETDQAGNRKLDDPSDYVRFEIASALARKIPVLPILIAATPMPSREQLPPELAELTYRNASRVDHGRDFRHQATGIIRDVEELARKDGSTLIVNTSLRIASFSKTSKQPFPIWSFTLMNRHSSSQILNHFKCAVIEYNP
jgi:hypothetical protein